jgi:RNA polymerase sigma-70 factor (ECF subfamily)
VFAILVVELPHFSYRSDRRFRGWLWTVMLNRWRQLQRRRANVNLAASDSQIEDAISPDHTGDLDDEEYRKYFVNRCLQLMQADFQPVTWKACWEYVVADRAASEVAAELGITVNAVHLAKSRVLRRLRAELQGLLD